MLADLAEMSGIVVVASSLMKQPPAPQRSMVGVCVCLRSGQMATVKMAVAAAAANVHSCDQESRRRDLGMSATEIAGRYLQEV